MSTPDPWADAQRLEGWAGEIRVNMIRAAALVAFYGHHLVNVYVLRDDPSLRGQFHAVVTGVVLVWAFIILALHLCLMRRYVPPVLKFVSTGADIVLITAMLMLTGEGPRSPLMLLFFLVIASAPLRLSLPLVYLATLGAMAASVALVGFQYFILLGPSAYYLPAHDQERVARPVQIIFLLALGAAGLLAGQMVRQARRLVEGYSVAVEEMREN
jgi:hypothetical protein